MKPDDCKNPGRPAAVRFSLLRWLVPLLFGFSLFANPLLQAQEAPPPEKVAPTTTFLVVRHAEREGEEDALSAAGRERAEQLKSLGQLLQVTAIYSTDYRRTRDTAAPLAEALGIEPRLYRELTPQWLTELRTVNRGGVVLIIGHSNTIATLASQLGNTPVAEIQPAEYDNLFVISEQATTRSLVQLRFGSSQPAPALSPEKMGPRQPAPEQPRSGAGSGRKLSAGQRIPAARGGSMPSVRR